MSGARYGVLWPDGGYTGGLTESYRDACAYARTVPGAQVYQSGTDADPECWIVKDSERARTPAAPIAFVAGPLST